MPPTPSIIEFVTDPALLGLSISPAQRTLLKAIYGLSLDAEELDLWRLCTGRERYPGQSFRQTTVLCGARSGKDSRIAAPVMLYEALFAGHDRFIAKGETGVLLIVAQDMSATRVAFGFIRRYLEDSLLLASYIESVRLSPMPEITLTNGLTIRCFPCTETAARGYAIVGGTLDELAFFRLEGSADSDVEIQTSITRGMGRPEQAPIPKLIKISTPYLRGGVLYQDFSRAFGQDNQDLLCWRAPTLLMNPTQQAHVERERQSLDPLRFNREYQAEFADDVAAFLPAAVVEQAVVPGRRELPPQVKFRYIAAVDASGGGDDAFTLAIVHVEGSGGERRIVQDVMRGWARRRGQQQLDLEATVKEIAACCKTFHLSTLHGDRYSSGWVVEAFKREGLRYVVPEIKTPDHPDNEKYLDKSMAYLELEPIVLQGRIDLLDHPPQTRELTLLERRPQPGGRTRVDHPNGGHDDHANALALAAALAARSPARPWAQAVLPEGVTVLGEPGGFGIAGGRAQTGPVGGQAAYIERYYR